MIKPVLTRPKSKLALLFGLFFIAVSPLLATMVPRMDLRSLTSTSGRILHGTVVTRWSAWDDSRRHIWTHYQIAVSEVLKGIPQTTFTLSEPGGIVGDTGMSISGVPQFEIGDEVVVFSFRTPAGYWRVRGFGQGKFNVITSANGAKTVRNSPGSIVLFDPPSRGGMPSRVSLSAAAASGLSLEQFKGLVRSVMAGQEGN